MPIINFWILHLWKSGKNIKYRLITKKIPQHDALKSPLSNEYEFIKDKLKHWCFSSAWSVAPLKCVPTFWTTWCIQLVFFSMMSFFSSTHKTNTSQQYHNVLSWTLMCLFRSHIYINMYEYRQSSYQDLTKDVSLNVTIHVGSKLGVLTWFSAVTLRQATYIKSSTHVMAATIAVR